LCSILARSILIEMRFHKVAALLILIFFAVPIATAFCCCTDFYPNQSRQEMSGQNHQGHDHGNHHSGSGKDDATSSESCECDIKIADLASRTAIDFSPISTHFSKLQNTPEIQFQTVSALQTQNAISFHDTGPPGSSSSAPLYLQLSVLRI